MSEQKKIDTQLFFAGANSDDSPELIEVGKGQYLDSKNMRRSSAIGNKNAKEKIKGEQILYDTYYLPSGTAVVLDKYTSLCYNHCNGYQIAVWASQDINIDPLLLPLITIDDKIVCQSVNLNYEYAYPIQSDINESCVGGEIFLTDFHIPPMYFNIQSLLDAYNSNSPLYFSDFDPNQYSTNLAKQNDQPVFTGYSTAGSNGLDTGMYAYAIRYRDTSGNTTQVSTFSPLIPVVKNYTDTTGTVTNFPQLATYSASLISTTYGINLKFRVTNVLNYASIDIVRIKWTDNNPLYQTVPSPQYYTIPLALTPNQISVETFTDDKSIPDADWLEMTFQEEVQVLAAIQAAKGIRYYDNRVILMNIKYASKDLTDVGINFTDYQDEVLYPFIQNMGVLGHSEPKNTTYYKGYQSGEKEGFAILCKDINNERTFALPINIKASTPTGYVFEVPNNRKALSPASKVLSVDYWKGAALAATTTSDLNAINGDFDYTHEIINIKSRGNSEKIPYIAKNKTNLGYTGSVWSIENADFAPIRPTRFDDTVQYGHDFTAIDTQYLDAGLTIPSGSGFSSSRVFAPEILSKGVALNGVTNLPNWVKSFSVVRTKPANRVVCQGIATYAFNGDGRTKYLDRIRVFSVDGEELALTITSDMYVQFISPLGFSNEILNAFNNNGVDRGIDMMLYARVAYNDAVASSTDSTNHNLLKSPTTASYWTGYGAWRNNDTLANNPFNDGGVINGDKLFEITSAVHTPTYGSRGYFWELILNNPCYKHSSVALYTDTNNASAQSYHEPFYLVNIINNEASIDAGNTTEYYETGHSQKVESIIGDTLNGLVLPLCDERFDDCIPSFYSNTKDLDDCFIYLRNKTTGIETKWLNVTYKLTATIQTIATGILTDGYYDMPSVFPYNTGATRIYGMYYHDWLGDNGEESTIKFVVPIGIIGAITPVFIPDNDSLVIVKYDHRYPLKVFGGDVTIGEAVGCFLDGKNDKDGDPEEEYTFGIPFPYNGITFNGNYKRVKNAGNSLNFLQSDHTYSIGEVRQLCVNFFSESIFNNPYNYSQVSPLNSYAVYRGFPRVNYIMHPEKWDATIANNFGTGKIKADYEGSVQYYPDEHTVWGYGGFMFKQVYGLDYSERNNYLPSTSKPIVGWREITDFCTRVIWSEQRNMAQQNVPNLRTFLSTSIYDIEDYTGEIKYAFDADTSKGNNLYAFTDKGVALLLTGKQQLGDATGNNIALIQVGDTFINGKIWLRKDVGMSDEMWRSAAEYAKTIFWANNESVFMMFDNAINDIGRLGYRKRLYFDGLQNVKPNYLSNVCGVFNRQNNEYWLDISQTAKNVSYLTDLIPNTVNYFVLGLTATTGISYLVTDKDWLNITDVDTLTNLVILPTDFESGNQLTFTNSSNSYIRVYDGVTLLRALAPNATITAEFNGLTWVITAEPKLNETFVAFAEGEQIGWDGTFDYFYEKLICLNDKVYGIRNGVIYETNLGYTLNGSSINASLTTVSNVNSDLDKEFISIMVKANNKPTSIEFANDMTLMPECTLSLNLPTAANTRYLKEYGKEHWTNLIPRKSAVGRLRTQAGLLFFKINHSADESFIVNKSWINWKPLKLQI